jgi:hypothetical protein
MLNCIDDNTQVLLPLMEIAGNTSQNTLTNLEDGTYSVVKVQPFFLSKERRQRNFNYWFVGFGVSSLDSKSF